MMMLTSACRAGVQARVTGRQKLLDADGVALVGERASPGDVLINKMTPLDTKNPMPPGQSSLGSEAYKAAPMAWKGPTGETCIVDRVLRTKNDEGHEVIKVGGPERLLLKG